MEQQSINTSASPEIEIEQVDGNLQVKGWDNSEVLAKSSSGDGLTLEHQEDDVHLSCHGDCILRVPYGAVVQILAVHGDARIKSLEEPLSIGRIDGSLALRDVAEVKIEAVHGNLEAKRISGNFQSARVDGNMRVRDLEGDFSAELIHGNLDLAAVAGVIHATADGNADLRLYDVTEGSYRVTARGNLSALVPEDASLKVNLISGGQNIALDLPEQRTRLNQGAYSFLLGDGEGEMELAADGNLSFKAETVEWAGKEDWDSDSAGRFEAQFGEDFVGVSGEFSQRLARQVEEQVQAQMARLNEQMSRLSDLIGKSGLSEEEAERVMRQAQETTEQATARAQEKIARAQERIARKLEAASRKAEQRARAAERRGRGSHGSHSFSFQWPGPPRPPVPPKEAGEPVTDEERMMILRMLEEKKISPEEAEMLLAALEGKGG